MTQRKYNKPDLDYAAIEAAISKGINDAVVTHARLGFAVPEWRDGKVVWVEPAEILADAGFTSMLIPPTKCDRQ